MFEKIKKKRQDKFNKTINSEECELPNDVKTCGFLANFL